MARRKIDRHRRIDYAEIARIAERTGESFDKIAKHVEDGFDIDDLRLPDENWLTVQQAAEVLGIAYHSILGDLRSSRVKQRTRSRVKPGARRGCGVLVLREDIERVAIIRDLCQLSSRAAMRVFDRFDQLVDEVQR